ncbi:MAG: hypothetical protein KDD45_10845 [Bdellovibrionales bacterium]|nr:hypothetical protein [Bdellovibrionales bacterium]
MRKSDFIFYCLNAIIDIMDRVEFKGDSPGARFGHTITPIGKDKAILFGGAVGDTGNMNLSQVDTLLQETLFFAITVY